MRTWIAIGLAAVAATDALGERLVVVLDAPPAAPLEVTAGDALCVWAQHIVGMRFSGSAFTARRAGSEGACVDVKADTYGVTVAGNEVTLEWSATGASTKAESAPATAAAQPTQPPATKSTSDIATLGSTPQEVLENFRKYTVDVPIPESPAFTVMNVTPTDVVRPSSLRAWATSLLHAVDKDGKLKEGVAIDGAPYALLNRKMSLGEYALLNPVAKALMNTHVSMGTAKGSESDDKSLKIGLGLRVRLFDRGDPRDDRELIECYRAAAGGRRPAEDFFTPGVAPGPFKECWTKRKSARWNASSGMLGLGQAWTSKTGNIGDRERSTRGAWGSLAYGFEELPGMQDNYQLIAHYKALDKERIADPLDATKMVDRDSRITAAQLRFGVESFNGMVEASWQRLSTPGNETQRTRRYAVGLEYRIAPNMWIVASTGGEKGGANDNKGFVMGAFRFGAATSPTFSPNP
jgi:hypothetical protein